jgi:glycosidase
MEGKDDPDNRRDFAGGFPGDKRNAFLPIERTAEQQRMWQWTRDWLRLRREHSAIRHGQLIDLFYDDDAYVFARQDEKETVIVVINRSANEKRVTIPASAIGIQDGAGFMPLYGAKSRATVANGKALVIIPARTAVAYNN